MKQYFSKPQLIAIGLVDIHCQSTYINTNIKKMYPNKTNINDLSIYYYYIVAQPISAHRKQIFNSYSVHASRRGLPTKSKGQN